MALTYPNKCHKMCLRRTLVTEMCIIRSIQDKHMHTHSRVPRGCNGSIYQGRYRQQGYITRCISSIGSNEARNAKDRSMIPFDRGVCRCFSSLMGSRKSENQAPRPWSCRWCCCSVSSIFRTRSFVIEHLSQSRLSLFIFYFSLILLVPSTVPALYYSASQAQKYLLY